METKIKQLDKPTVQYIRKRLQATLTPLAKELGVGVEFIPFTSETVIKMIDQGQFDVAVGGLVVTPGRLTRLGFSNPYLDLTIAVVVEDHRRQAFKNWRTIDQERNTRLGVVGKITAHDVKRHLPNTDIVPMKSIGEFFKDNPDSLDVVVTTAEAGSAWTILYPAYSVVVPEPHLKSHAAFALPLGDTDLENFINDWLHMKKTRGIIDNLYDKWILGKEVEHKKLRWSIGRNVLGWWE